MLHSWHLLSEHDLFTFPQPQGHWLLESRLVGEGVGRRLMEQGLGDEGGEDGVGGRSSAGSSMGLVLLVLVVTARAACSDGEVGVPV